MSLESFYGGKQGISPVIKASFQYIDRNDDAYQAALNNGMTATELLPLTMDLCFENSNYKDVWYDELCIIDTTNKNNPNNGKLFRRTLKNAGDTGENRCAEYIGRIVGPAGTNPFFSFGNLNFVNEQGTINNISSDPAMQVSYPTDSDGTISFDKFNENEERFNIEPYVQEANITNAMLVAGKVNNTYNDSIKYTWLNVLDDRNDTTAHSIIYMGFQIPYPVLEIESETIDWWNQADINKIETNHPFYHPWTISIPRGIRGNAAGNIRLVQQKEFNNTGGTSSKPTLYDFANDLMEVENKPGVYVLKTKDHYGPTLPSREGIENSYIWVYDYTFYDVDAYNDSSTEETELNKTYTFYLGTYNEISNVTLEDDGTLVFHYSNATENTFKERLSWITDISIDNSGILDFTWNQDKYYIRTEDITPNTNKNYYIYNNNQYVFQPNITNFENGVIYYEGSKIYSTQLPYPTSAIINDDGSIVINLTTTALTLKDSNSEDYHLDYVKSLDMDDETKVLSYTTSVDNYTDVLNGGKGINYIEAMTIDNNFHLLAYYSSNQYRPPASNTYGTITWQGWTYRNNYPYSNNNVTITASDYWRDFGVVKDTAGVKVTTEVDYSRLNNDATINNYTINQFLTNILNPTTWSDGQANPYYNGNIPGTAPSGLTLRGTLVFASQINYGSFFFFDYAKNEWCYAGSLSESTQVDAQIELNTGSSLNNQSLSTYGVTLIEKTAVAPVFLLPNFGV